MIYCRYALVRNAGSKSVEKLVWEGFGQHVRKSDVLTFVEEQLIIASKFCSVEHPQGLNNCMVIFCLCNFFIRSQCEVRATFPIQFDIGVNIHGDEYLRYDSCDSGYICGIFIVFFPSNLIIVLLAGTCLVSPRLSKLTLIIAKLKRYEGLSNTFRKMW
jgi:hypothetical protein